MITQILLPLVDLVCVTGDQKGLAEKFEVVCS